jgi:Na+-driven multidrug efflux pump
MALTTFVSQNLGARRYDRVKSGTRTGIIMSVVVAQPVGVAYFLLAPQLISLFSKSPEVIAYGVQQARVEALFYGLLAFAHSAAAVLRGAGRPMIPMAIMLGIWCILRIGYITAMVHLFQVITVVTYGSASASSVVIGKAVGEGDIPRVKSYAKTLQILYIFIGLLTSAVLWLCKDGIISLYSITEATKDLTVQFIAVLSVTVIGTAYQCACLTGIVTGGGDTKFVLINDLIHQWLIVIPAAFLSAFVFHAPLWVTFACLKSDQVLKCFVAIVKVNRFKWIKVLTRENTEKA